MGATVESLPAKASGLRSSSLKRSFSLQVKGCRIFIDPDGSVRSFYSLQEKRALFGFEQVWLYKVQAGIVIHSQRPDWLFRLNPRSVQLTAKAFDGVEVAQSVEFYRSQSLGFIRRLRLRNGGPALLRLRVIELVDPTAAHFGETSSRWGSLGVNAFNRESHVAMDEVSDPPSARVVGSTPSPSKFYMTTNTSRAQEFLSVGELPEATAGMSGQVLVLSCHEIELPPGESWDLTFASMYNPGKLEDALSDFGRLQAGEKQLVPARPLVACSEQAITDSASWALPAIEGGAYSEDALDRYEALRALTYLDPALARKVMGEAKPAIRRDGSLPHSLSPSSPGALETAVFLKAAATHLVLAQDKKLSRAWYPVVRKLAGYLLSQSKEFTVQMDSNLPQGWRRHLGRGYPTGEIPEVSLAVAGGLAAASQLARAVSKPEDAGKFRERSEMISEQVRKRLLDDRGFLSLCRDSTGRLRSDETVDMAVAAYRHSFLASAEQAAAHRLLEKDFDTQYGPRCVPTTNMVYFNRAYGKGQLGGVWTRAALAHAVVCYRVGLSGIGSLAVGKVARLVSDDAPRLGGIPGEYPQWVDVDTGEAHADETDPVAAARFVEALLEGELGLPAGAEKASLTPAASSNLRWLLVSELWTGEPLTAFLGRGGGRPHLFYSGGRADSKAGTKFVKAERVEIPLRGVYCVTFYTPGQVVCLGNCTASLLRFAVTFPARAAELSKHLSASLEAYEPSKSSWTKTGSLKVSPAMSFETSLEPNEWKVFRLSAP